MGEGTQEGVREVRLSGGPSSSHTGLEAEAADALEDQISGVLRAWLKDHEFGGLSAAQLASHLTLQIWHSPSPLQRLMEWNLQATEPREERVRNLFPLPLWHDDVEHLKMVVTAGSYKDSTGQWRERGDTRSRAQKALRLEGLKTWHGLAVIGLNFLHGDREKGTPPWPGSQATIAQEQALVRIWDMLKVFFDDKERVGVPRTPLHDWDQEIKDLSISYTGEVVEKAKWVTLEQILPGLPSPEHGGLVNILELVPPDIAEALQHPERLIREDWPEQMPKPRVLCEDAEWDRVVEALFQRNIVQPIDTFVQVGEDHVLNGVFGVPKADKKLPSGEEVLRLIIDLRASNWLLHQLDGDTQTLTGAASFQRIMVSEGEELLVSGEDLVSAFYLFALPACWAPFMALGKSVPGRCVGRPEEEWSFVGLSVLPMGWHSSVGIMQAAHRRIALGSPLRGGAGLSRLAEISRTAVFPDLDEGAGWSIYLDDTTILEKLSAQAVADLEGRPPKEQEQLRCAYEWWGIPTNPQKALVRCQKAERLGALIDGKRGVLRTTTKRSLDLISLGTWIRGQKWVPRKTLQVYAGKAVHILQFRRCLFSCLDVLFRAIAHGPSNCPVTEELRSEMFVLEVLLPLTQCDLKAAVDPIVTASDACETGAGVCYASRLTRAGEEEVKQILETGEVQGRTAVADPTQLGEEEKVLIIDLFAGIGGLTLSLEKAGVHWCHLGIVEKDPDCRRLLRRTYPGATFHSDVTRFGKKEISDLIKKVPGITGVVVGGGSPCQGLSRLSSKRRHFDDERSSLFFEASRIFREVDEVAAEKKLWVLKMLENVVADPADIREMSRELKMQPTLVDAQYLSRARRPRLFWLSVEPVSVDDVEVVQHQEYRQLVYKAKVEPLALFLQDQCEWEAGLRDEKARFPTFTRCIARARPPPDPAGLSETEAGARARWEGDLFRYPPYTYKDEYMVLTPECVLRPLVAEEREILMGYQPGHTSRLLKKPPSSEGERRAAEDMQCSAIGNSFHTNSVACLLDHALATMGLKTRKGVEEIVQSSMARQATRCQATEPPLVEDSEQSQLGREDDSISVGGALKAEEMERRGRSAKLLADELHDEKKLSSLLVSAYVRRQEFRGSDVRLDISALYRPDSFPRGSVEPHRWIWHRSHSFPFKGGDHINVLELRALVHTFEWRLRNHAFGGCRALHLTDSQVALAVSTKGRSSSQSLNRILRKFAALQIAGGVWPLLAYVESAKNPADGPSREYES